MTFLNGSPNYLTVTSKEAPDMTTTWTRPIVTEAPKAPTTPADIIRAALDASAEAAFRAVDSLGGDRGDCGGAWVVLPSQKGRKALVDALKARNIPTGQHYPSGVSVTLLRNLPVQSRLPRERGCDAFVDVLQAHGFKCYTYSYAD